jgi:hypothetical protein
MQEVIISFDVREMWLDMDAFWTPERRNVYLLKQDVTKPLSVDTTVWCSVFEIDSGIESPPPVEGTLPRTIVWEGIPRLPEYQTEFWDEIFSVDYHLRSPSQFPYWWYLQEMKQALSDGWSQHWKPCWIIAITEFMDDTGAKQFAGVTEPDVISPEWKLLGYDILGGGTGFLTNAGYREEEIEHLNKTIMPHLNQYHLFPTRELAEEHFDMVYQRDPGHGGFTINGLYLIESVNVEQK